MPFIGIYRNLFPRAQEIKDDNIVAVTIGDSQSEAYDAQGNRFNILNAYSSSFFSKEKKLKFEVGKIYMADVVVRFKKAASDVVGESLAGELYIVKTNMFGTYNL